jgi:hypothetical protein
MATKNGKRGRVPSHGHSFRGAKTLTYKKWCGMHRRCRGHNPKDIECYVEKGIGVCERWTSFSNFLADMGECPIGLTLDRVDNSKGYEPSNCRWASTKVQACNRSMARILTFNGQSLNLTEWARRIGIGQPTLSYRLKSGWTVEKALTTSPEIYKSR